MPHRIFGGNTSQLHNHAHHLCHFALDVFHSSTRDHLTDNRAIRLYLRAGVPSLHSMPAYFADTTEMQAEVFHLQCKLVDGSGSTSSPRKSKAVSQRPFDILPQFVWSRFGLPASLAATAAAAQPPKRESTPPRLGRKDAFVRPYKLFAALHAQRVSKLAGAHV
ncbi:uncharacterized protein PgNI_03103 [Pyricularia grisea]|uniref:Uncharacterized protein n=1 Tax=Pyricularia grisea TaxID=148305 RepID=A0A6P8BE53_PYRGI|nr:uncharacterized protein PgNI_03103 [Pyricularia grisea]TLD14085.1 hypothetical protein PgNI_03103 [Pyricularia grisea]